MAAARPVGPAPMMRMSIDLSGVTRNPPRVNSSDLHVLECHFSVRRVGKQTFVAEFDIEFRKSKRTLPPFKQVPNSNAF